MISLTPPLEVPVLLLVFRRLDTLRRVVDALRTVQPTRVYIAADGPKEGDAATAAKCAEVRQYLAEALDWPCAVKTLYRESNLGCGAAVSGGISWFFEHEAEGIILEDDTLPCPDFFPYCAGLLERHRNDKRVMCITGDNFQDGQWRGEGDYYFSKHPHCWGWASWRRAWALNTNAFPGLEEAPQTEWWQSINDDPAESLYWERAFGAARRGEVDTWDYQWTYACWQHGGLTALPNVNLVANIGFGGEATHTMDATHQWSERQTGSLESLRPPAAVERDAEADLYTFTHHHCPAGSEAERILWEALIKQQRRENKELRRKLADVEKQNVSLAKELKWAVAHKWKAARRLLSGKWPEG
jgi:hypothetical protein